MSSHIATLEKQNEILAKLGNSQGKVGTVRHARLKVVDGAANIYFGDPDDAQIEGVYTAFWANTVIVRKSGSTPTSPTDGTVVLTNTTRNAYLTTPFVDSAYATGDVYRAFTYTTSGAYNDSLYGVIKDYVLFGMLIDETDSNENTCVHYLEDCANFERGSMTFGTDGEGTWDWGDWFGAFFMPRPCMLKTDGTVDYYLDPDDYTKKADGVTASDVTDSSYDGNAMMEWTPVFMKVVPNSENGDNSYRVYFSDKKVDADFECFSGLKADGTYGNWYTAIYEGTVVNSKLRSYSSGATPNCQTSATTELTYARNNGTDYTPMRWADEQLITYLAVLVLGRLNFQAAIQGTAWKSISSRTLVCGSCDTKGMFYGKNEGGSSVTIGNKIFGMENKFGHLWNRVVGATSVENRLYVKMTKHNLDGSTATDFATSDVAGSYTGGLYVDTEQAVPSANGSYINSVGKTKYTLGFFKAVTGGAADKFYCDAAYSSAGVRGVLLGGSLNAGSGAGRFAVNAVYAPSNSVWIYSASLSYRPF